MNSPPERISRIVIVGGGSAGWLTAGILAAEHRASSPGGLQFTLVESPDVSPVGVGEGTWPSMRDSLRDMGVSETDFIRECDVSFKQASRFARWVTGAEDDVYYHPFALPLGYGEVNLASQWRALRPNEPFASAVSCQAALCDQGRAPKQVTTPEWAAVANYAYHLDAGKFGIFLQKFCTTTEAHGKIEGDLFIDCTGFAAILLGGHYGIPFISRNDILFCDTALALQVPYPEPAAPIASNTLSTAQKAGWIWDIGLPTRRGVGHVYSSAHTSDEQAELALRHYIQPGRGNRDGADATARKISFKPGHRETFWHRNCVAVGIAAGFIEPLEASALALIELSAAMIRDEMPATRGCLEVVARRFNERFQYRWDRIVEFLKLHYLLSKRTDSDFWLDNRRMDTIPSRLVELMELWRYRPPSRRDFHEIEEIFPAASYQFVLYGMGFEPYEVAHRRSDDSVLAGKIFAENAATTGKFLAGLPSNRELIRHVISHGLPKI